MLTKTYVQDWSPESVWIECTPSRFALDSLFHVQEVGRFRCQDNYYTEHENIHSFLVMFTESGQGELHCRGESYQLTAGDLLFTDCMEWHSYQTTGSGGWDMIWLHFNGVSAQGYYEQYVKAGSPVTKPKDEEDIRTTMLELIKINQSGGKYAELKSGELITHLLTTILIGSDAVPASRTQLPAFVEQALKDINAHLKDDLTLDHFSRTLGVNKYHLQKEFKRYVGMSPNAYVCAARINVAKSLLLSNDLSVSQVAEQAGFRNVGHFMNMFKRATGLTPGEYRRRGMFAPSPSEE